MKCKNGHCPRPIEANRNEYWDYELTIRVSETQWEFLQTLPRYGIAKWIREAISEKMVRDAK